METTMKTTLDIIAFTAGERQHLADGTFLIAFPYPRPASHTVSPVPEPYQAFDCDHTSHQYTTYRENR